MARVILECGACGAENEREEKPDPVNRREANLVYFICGSCGRKNLRDRSVPGIAKEVGEPVVVPQEVTVVDKAVVDPQERKEGSGLGFILGTLLAAGGAAWIASQMQKNPKNNPQKTSGY